MVRLMNRIFDRMHKTVVTVAVGLTIISTGLFAYRTYEILFVPVEERLKAKQELDDLLHNEEFSKDN